jgi:hypothetical protein
VESEQHFGEWVNKSGAYTSSEPENPNPRLDECTFSAFFQVTESEFGFSTSLSSYVFSLEQTIGANWCRDAH